MTRITVTHDLTPELRVLPEMENRKQRGTKIRVVRMYRIHRDGANETEEIVLVRYHNRMNQAMSALLAVEGHGQEMSFRELQMCSRGNEKTMIDQLYEREGAHVE